MIFSNPGYLSLLVLCCKGDKQPTLGDYTFYCTFSKLKSEVTRCPSTAWHVSWVFMFLHVLLCVCIGQWSDVVAGHPSVARRAKQTLSLWQADVAGSWRSSVYVGRRRLHLFSTAACAERCWSVYTGRHGNEAVGLCKDFTLPVSLDFLFSRSIFFVGVSTDHSRKFFGRSLEDVFS